MQMLWREDERQAMGGATPGAATGCATQQAGPGRPLAQGTAAGPSARRGLFWVSHSALLLARGWLVLLELDFYRGSGTGAGHAGIGFFCGLGTASVSREWAACIVGQ